MQNENNGISEQNENNNVSEQIASAIDRGLQDLSERIANCIASLEDLRIEKQLLQEQVMQLEERNRELQERIESLSEQNERATNAVGELLRKIDQALASNN